MVSLSAVLVFSDFVCLCFDWWFLLLYFHELNLDFACDAG